MFTQTIKITDLTPSESFQLIAHETLQMVVISSQVLSSSRIHHSTYKEVVFSDCHFYACDFQGVVFENCIFENCIFEFSHFRKCQFRNCNFNDCNWHSSSSISSIYEACDLQATFLELCKNGMNLITKGPFEHTTDIYINLDLALAA